MTADLCTWQGSACTSASLEPSYVLRALGVEDDLVREPTPRRPFRGCDSHLMRECCRGCAGALVDPVRLRPVHDRGGGGLGGEAHRDPRPTAARHVAALRDAPGRHRYQLHPVVAALKSARPGLVVERGWRWVLAQGGGAGLRLAACARMQALSSMMRRAWYRLRDSFTHSKHPVVG